MFKCFFLIDTRIIICCGYVPPDAGVGAMARTKDNQKNTDKGKKTKAASPKNRKKAGAGAGSNPLKRSFDASSSSSQATTPGSPSDIQKCHQSGFITYAKAAAASKDPSLSEQASNVLDMYRTMSPQQKKELVVSFFKAGGKRSGLGVVHTQVVKLTDTATEASWSGYATPAMIMDLFKASPRK